MDGIVIIIASIVMCLLYRPVATGAGTIDDMDVITPNPRLNPEMLHDEHAFMRIANELGFH